MDMRLTALRKEKVVETTIQRVSFTQRLLRVLRQKAERERKLAEERLQNSGPKNWRARALHSMQCPEVRHAA
jgi:hypothetical protein